MAKKYQAPLGASLIVLSSVFYASYGIWTKLLGSFFDGFTATVFRSVIVVAILLPIAFLNHSFQPIHLKENWRYIVGLTVASLFTWGTLYFAILQAGLGVSLTVTYASIVIGQFFFGWLFAGERFTKDKAFSALLGFIGLALIFSPATRSAGWTALVAASVSGLSTAANTVFAKQIKYNATQSTIMLWATGIVANIFMVALLHRHYPAFNWEIQWLYLLIFSVASVIASWSLVRGVKLIDAGAAGILGLLEIVFGILFGAVFFHERPGIMVLIGAAVIVAAAAVPYVRDYNSQRRTLE
jgi:drug/metabolite transporter (DMT)-like permease